MTGLIRRLIPALVLAAFAATPALAHPGHSIPIDELTRNSATVLEGTVTAVASAWNPDRTRIYTTVDLRSDGLYKGAAAQTVRLVFLGGTVDEITFAVLGQPRFQLDEHVVLFLGPQWELSSSPVFGGEHGKFTVTRDSRTGREFLFNEGATLPKSDVLTRVRTTTAAQPTDR